MGGPHVPAAHRRFARLALMRPRSVHRFYVAQGRVSEDRVHFTPEQAHQIARVLRLRRGDTVTVFDGTGAEYTAELTALGTGKAAARLTERRAAHPEPPRHLVLLQGVVKGEKMDLIIQKATELGVRRIVPVLCERSVPKGLGRPARWRIIATEAAEQCGRAILPELDDPVPLPAFLEAERGGGFTGITLWEDERSRGLKEAMQIVANAERLYLLVGPEGGLAAHEVKLAEGAGLITASLGRRTLRAETATLAVLGIIQYELGDLGLPPES
ncbi:MAG: 16S rRNA (uracil(1498)-N(3))-methyltransferase [Candidatus Methylomirabilaceae bacterium]